MKRAAGGRRRGHGRTRAPKSTRASRSGAARRARAQAGAKRARKAIAAAPVTASDLRALRREIDRRMAPMRWNPAPEDVQRSVAQLVLTIVEFLRRLMERQAIRRMEQKTLSRAQVDAVGTALMQLENTILEIGARFGLTADDLNLDLGPAGTLM
jgi:gas vesicle protein GvpK